MVARSTSSPSCASGTSGNKYPPNARSRNAWSTIARAFGAAPRSLSMALRGISIIRVAPAAFAVAVRRRPEMAHLAEEIARRQLGDLELLRLLFRALPQLHAAGDDDLEVARVVVLAEDRP